MYKIVVGTVFGLLLFSNSAMALCSSYPYTLTNGTTADANQVMDNFNCIMSGPVFSGNVGIGMTPVNVLDIAQNQNGSSIISISNNSNASSASAYLQVTNGTYDTSLRQLGTGYTTTGSWTAGDGLLYGAFNLTIQSAGTIRFASNNSTTEIARFGTDGSFLVGTTANGGWVGNGKMAVVLATGQGVSSQVTGGSSNAFLGRVDDTTSALAGFYYQTTSVGSITTSGTTTYYNTTSDERLKNWHIPQSNYEQIIRQLWVGDFKWNNDGHRDFGYRAQQAYSLVPGAVHRPTDPAGQWQMDYGKTAPLAMWGVKDLYRITYMQERKAAATSGDVKNIMQQMNELRRVSLRQAAHMDELKAANENDTAQILSLRTQVSVLERQMNTRTAQK